MASFTISGPELQISLPISFNGSVEFIFLPRDFSRSEKSLIGGILARFNHNILYGSFLGFDSQLEEFNARFLDF